MLNHILRPLPHGWEKLFTIGKEVMIITETQFVPIGSTGIITAIETPYHADGRAKEESELTGMFFKGKVLEVTFDFPISVEIPADTSKKFQLESTQFQVEAAKFSPSQLLIVDGFLVKESLNDKIAIQELKDGVIHIWQSGNSIVMDKDGKIILGFQTESASPTEIAEAAFSLKLVRSVGVEEIKQTLGE
jgi:hypothetical protein